MLKVTSHNITGIRMVEATRLLLTHKLIYVFKLFGTL